MPAGGPLPHGARTVFEKKTTWPRYGPCVPTGPRAAQPSHQPATVPLPAQGRPSTIPPRPAGPWRRTRPRHMRVFLKTVKFFRFPGCGSGASLPPEPYAGRHFLTRSRSPGVLLKIGHGEEWAAAVYPAPCLQDGAGTSVGQVKRAIAIKSIGPGTARYIRPDVSADARLCGRGSNRTLPPVAMSRRLACHHGHRPNSDRYRSCLWPAPARWCHRHADARQTLGRHNMGLNKLQHRIQRCAARPHGIGHGGQADRHALQSIALGLTVQGLMLTELRRSPSRRAGNALVPHRGEWPDAFAICAGDTERRGHRDG